MISTATRPVAPQPVAVRPATAAVAAVPCA